MILLNACLALYENSVLNLSACWARRAEKTGVYKMIVARRAINPEGSCFVALPYSMGPVRTAPGKGCACRPDPSLGARPIVLIKYES